MGVVYLAEDPLLNRQVAIKMVDLSVEDTSQRKFLRDRLLRDAKAAAMLSHPNIVNVYDVIEEGETAYVVMEYLEARAWPRFSGNSARLTPGLRCESCGRWPPRWTSPTARELSIAM